NHLFSPITKRSALVGTADTGELTRDCMALASAPRPGPVHLALPSDLAVVECGYAAKQPAATASHAADSERIPEIAHRLEPAARPLILIGLGAKPANAPAMAALLSQLQAPFLVTPKAKGICSEESPLFLGVASGMAIDRDILETIHCADLVLGIGFDPVECD